MSVTLPVLEKKTHTFARNVEVCYQIMMLSQTFLHQIFYNIFEDLFSITEDQTF